MDGRSRLAAWGRRRMRRRAAAWLALAGMLSLLFMPLVDGGPLRSAGAPVLAADGIEVCTPNGLYRIRLDDDGQPAPTPSHKHAACAFCTAHPGFSLPALVLPPPLAPDWPEPAAVPAPAAIAAPRLFVLVCHGCRAPPPMTA